MTVVQGRPVIQVGKLKQLLETVPDELSIMATPNDLSIVSVPTISSGPAFRMIGVIGLGDELLRWFASS